MNNEQILKVLKNERECILSNHDNCYEKCRETCPYYVSGVEKMEVLDFLINGYELLQNEGAESYTIKCKEPLSEEQIAHLKNEYERTICQATITALPDNFKAIILGEEKGDSE